MPSLSSGDTLSLKQLGTAIRTTATGSGVSLNSLNDSAGTEVKLSNFAGDSIDGISGFTYVVENTSETYRLNFSGTGSHFSSKIADQSANFTWSVPAGSKLSVSSNSGETAVFAASTMTDNTDNTDQTTLQTVATHTIRVVFDDTFNGHMTNFGANRDKTVYSVDSYDNNAAALCLTADSPITKWDGSIVEVGDLDEGDELIGYNPNNLNLDSDEDFFEWNAKDVLGEFEKVKVKDIIYSFASSYYNINDGEITATSEHPMLVWDSTDELYKFKEMFRIEVGDRLIKAAGGIRDGLVEVNVDKIEVVKESVEIVSINVEEVDTYLVNGYVTHNKGGNTHTDASAPNAPTSLAYDDSAYTLSWSGDGTNDVYDLQVSMASNFAVADIVVDETEWSATSYVYGTPPSSGTYYARVRQYGTNGLLSSYSSTLEFTQS
jgi:hypothetical protein